MEIHRVIDVMTRLKIHHIAERGTPQCANAQRGGISQRSVERILAETVPTRENVEPASQQPPTEGRRRDGDGIRKRVEELAEGGVELNETDLQSLADRRGLSGDTVNRALDERSTRPDAWLRTLATSRFGLVDDGVSRILGEAAKVTRAA